METILLDSPLCRPTELTSRNADGKSALTLEGAAYLIHLFQHGYLIEFDPDLAGELDALPYLRLDRDATKRAFQLVQEKAQPAAKEVVKEAADVLWHMIREFQTEALAWATTWLRGVEAEAKLTELFARELRIEGEEAIGYYPVAGGFTCFDTTTQELDCRIVWTKDEDAAHRWLLGTIDKQALPQQAQGA